MTLSEQAERRVDLARQLGCEPVRWVATEAIVSTLSDDAGRLAGVPITEGQPHSDWGLQLILAAQC